VRLGIDPGSARIGVARCDPGGLLATPLDTVPRGPGDLDHVVRLALEHDALEVIAHQREYINPFAPEPAPAAVEAPAKVEQPVASVPAVPSALATSVTPPAAVTTMLPAAVHPPARQAVVETKPQLNILPPEEKARPAQSWEIGGQPAQPAADTAPRRENRRDFRPTRHEDRERPTTPSEHREPRREFRPRDQQPREPRSFEPKPAVTPIAPVSRVANNL